MTSRTDDKVYYTGIPVEQSIPNDKGHNSRDITSLQCSAAQIPWKHTAQAREWCCSRQQNYSYTIRPIIRTTVLVVPAVAQRANKFSALQGTSVFITVFTRASHCSLTHGTCVFSTVFTRASHWALSWLHPSSLAVLVHILFFPLNA
jgi:hypothetical protein